jgi:hypothetical protein
MFSGAFGFRVVTHRKREISRIVVMISALFDRYVPVGMLEVIPQQMNHRPPNNMVSFTHVCRQVCVGFYRAYAQSLVLSLFSVRKK